MAPRRGLKTDRRRGGLGAFARAVGFLIMAGTALAILAAAALLPAWQRREQARLNRDQLASEAQTQQRLVQYKQRMVEAIKRDPRQTAQLLVQQQHYRVPGQVPVQIVDAPADLPVAQLLAARSPQPRPITPLLAELAERLSHVNTRRGMLLVAGILMVGALTLFLPPEEERRKTRRPGTP